MKVTVPHAGNLWVALRTCFAKAGVEAVEPPRSSKRTMSLGVRHSPEWMCVPYKITLGNFIEAIEQGADTVIMAEGPNLCRLGCYARLQEKAIHDMGYDQVKVLTFNWQDEQIVGLAKFLRQILGEDRPWREIIGYMKHGIQQLVVMEDLEKRVHHLRPRAKDPADVTKIWRTAGERVSAAMDGEQLKVVKEELNAELDAVELNPEADPLKVGLLGEFFMVLDPFCNLDVEDELGRRGVEVVRSAWIAEWAKIWLFLEMIGISHGKKVKAAARPYLSRDVSGDAIQTLGETVLHAQEGFDGIVHLQPFTCMPEIMAQNILPKVSREHDIPVLCVIIDEQMGKTGFITRLEAFVDLMRRRRDIAKSERRR
ncbi:MAG: CoA protein activase [Anaerolineae bacterium]